MHFWYHGPCAILADKWGTVFELYIVEQPGIKQAEVLVLTRTAGVTIEAALTAPAQAHNCCKYMHWGHVSWHSISSKIASCRARVNTCCKAM